MNWKNRIDPSPGVDPRYDIKNKEYKSYIMYMYKNIHIYIYIYIYIELD